MDLEILKKKISTFRGDGGRVRITDDALMMEILSAWEQWKGPLRDFYRSIGVSSKGMASIIGRAKRMRREGHFPAEEFKEVKLEAGTESSGDTALAGSPSSGIELVWSGNRVIRFGQVDSLVEFLKKAA